MFSALTFNQESIVNEGLILYLDAADKTSYPNIGTNWYDLSGNGYGELAGSYLFSSTNGRGSIGFDQTDEIVTLSSTTFNTSIFNSHQSGSISVWFRIDTSSAGLNTTNTNLIGGPLIGFDTGNNRPILNVVRSYSANGNNALESALIICDNENSGNSIQVFAEENLSPANPAKYADGNWYNVVLTVGNNTLTGTKVYINGNAITLSFTDGDATSNSWLFRGTTSSTLYLARNATTLGSGNNRQMFFGGDIGIYMIYNRALTQNEVLQNYNALKDRFR